ncbi:MAG: FHA domain-containing protein [Desulfococcaceae bacterium]|jgi:pSer/pThr/pTyr-binding forkhead associated (FHA) protein|nr:FHA domain-containing protein [Desulfococcaceae bacterium]
MPILTLKFQKDEKKLDEFVLEKGKSFTIGRLHENDIVIENLAVSGHHAKIDSVGEKFLLTDLNSKNGTFVNEQPLTAPHWLRHGDIIIVGKHYLVFAYTAGETPEDDSDAMQHTMVMDTEKYREMMARARQNTAPAQEAPKESVGMLSFLTGGEGEIELIKKLTKIGKNASSDIVVTGLTIGQTAATISKMPKGYYLNYVGGMSKPKVNGETVKGQKLLSQFDTIEIGSLKMQFFFKE